MVTTREIAGRAGVTRPVVSWVLNGRWKERRIGAHTRDRVLSAAHQLGYRPNRLAQGLRARKTNTIGLVIRVMDHPLQGAVNERIVRLLESQGYEVIITVVPDFDDIGEIEELYYSHYPEGMILGPLYGQRPAPFLTKLAADGFPLIAFHGALDCECDQVTYDARRSLELAFRHLQERGHQRVGMVVGAPHPGWEEALRHLLGNECGRTYVSSGTLRNGHEFALNLRRGAGDPTAFVLQDPLFAIGFLRGACERGWRVPEDVAFVVLADTDVTDYQVVTMTTVYPDLDEMVEKVVQLLFRRLKGELPREPQLVQVQPRLIPGESTMGKAPLAVSPRTI